MGAGVCDAVAFRLLMWCIVVFIRVPVNRFGRRLSTFGERLRDERKRLGLSQPAFGELCGVQKGAQINYEKGERAPDVAYLARALENGVDVLYLLTGATASAALPPDEQRLVALYRLAPSQVRQAVLAALAVGQVPAAPPRKATGVQVNVHPGGNVGQVGGSVQGDLRMGNVTIRGKKP